MSGFLAGKVWQSDLDGDLKPLAAALADIANDDGSSIYPSVAYVAWLLKRTERSVQARMKELRERGILKVVRQGGRWPGDTTEYCLIEANLPTRGPWRGKAMGEDCSPMFEAMGEVHAGDGCSLRHEGVKQASPNPSVNRKINQESGPGLAHSNGLFTDVRDYALRSWSEKFGEEPNWSGKDFKGLKDLIRRKPRMTAGLFRERWDYYLADDLAFVKEHAWSLALFCSRWDRYAPGVRQEFEFPEAISPY